jgi:3-methyladenine DNA glycosylase AlkD
LAHGIEPAAEDLMPPKPKRANTGTQEALDALERAGSKKVRDEMAPRYGILAAKAFGTPVAEIRLVAKSIGKSHELAADLWNTGVYEARMLSAFVADPQRVTKTEMERWCRDFDNWAICDTMCFHLFDRTPHAFDKIEAWAGRREEFVKRAAFALLASVALHDKKAPDEPFLRALPLIERAAVDERNFVKKGVSWALRGIGKRNAKLKAAASEVARRLSGSEHAASRWIGKDALREFAKR